jgi:hypothetical protein
MRWWNERVADLGDTVPPQLLAVLSVVGAILLSLALYFWPHWLPWHWTLSRGSRRERTDLPPRWRWRWRLGGLRWRWRRRRRGDRSTPAEPRDDLPPDELPDLPAEVFVLTADQLAAQGRYREAVRERLRAIVRDLIDRGVIPFTPGWTVTELASAAAFVRPALSDPLRGAAAIFSEIWYGQRPALAADDLAMRAHAAAVTAALDQTAVAP